MFKLRFVLICWSCAAFLLPCHIANYYVLMYSPSIPFWVLVRTILLLVFNGVQACRMVMRTTNCTAYTLCLPLLSCLCVCIACMRASSVQRFPSGSRRHCTKRWRHTCTAHPHHCLQVSFPGLEPPGCRSGPRISFLWMCGNCFLYLSLLLAAQQSTYAI